MNTVFTALPGIEVPVAGMRRALEQIWESETPMGKGAPSEFRASQMNLVLHFGLPVTPEDALAQFDVALRFAQRYPCRLIVLVPLVDAPAGAGLQAKLYSQCYVGRTRSEMSCTEALILAYPQEARAYVSDQVSTLIEADLPVYYWVHRFSSCAKVADYQYLLRTARRFIFDSGIAPAGALAYPWPRPDTLRDLAAARLLPVRQLLGQFFSGFPAAPLGRGVRAVEAVHGASTRAEAQALQAWARAALQRCAGEGAVIGGAVTAGPRLGADEVELRVEYDDPRHFRWRADFAPGWAGLEADLGTGRIHQCNAVRLAAPEAALGEAMFF